MAGFCVTVLAAWLWKAGRGLSGSPTGLAEKALGASHLNRLLNMLAEKNIGPDNCTGGHGRNRLFQNQATSGSQLIKVERSSLFRFEFRNQ